MLCSRLSNRIMYNVTVFSSHFDLVCVKAGLLHYYCRATYVMHAAVHFITMYRKLKNIDAKKINKINGGNNIII